MELDTSKTKVEEELAKVEACVVKAESEVSSTQDALNASLAREAALKEKVEVLKSQTYKDEILGQFRASKVYKNELESKVIKYYERGCLGVLHQLYHLVDNKECLLDVFEAPFDAPTCREGSDCIT